MKVRIAEDAIRQIKDGASFYELQASGLGNRFRRSVFTDIKQLRITGGVHEIVYGRFHRSVARHYPFGIYYKVESGQVVVYAVIDSRRDPKRIRDELR